MTTSNAVPSSDMDEQNEDQYLDGDSGLLYYFRVVDGKEVLGLSERRVRAACESQADSAFLLTHFRNVCTELGIEIGTP